MEATSFVFAIATATVIMFGMATSQSADGPGPSAPYITFAGNFLPNNSGVLYSSLRPTMVVRCNTDLNTTTCCGGNKTYGGTWTGLSRSQPFLQSEVEGGVVMYDVRDDGNYRCEIDTAASVARGGPRDILYFTVFRAKTRRRANILLRAVVIRTQPPLFSLTCQAYLWPATSITWKRDAVDIEGGVITSVTKSSYFNVLNVTEEGVYTCEVFSEAIEPNRTESGQSFVTTPLPLTNLTVTQTGNGYVQVSWSSGGRVRYYIITYTNFDNMFSTRTTSRDSSVTLGGLYSNAYSLRVTAVTAISSSVLGPVNVTLSQMFVGAEASVPRSGAYLGQTVRLSCTVTITGPLNITEAPTITWYTLLPDPNITVFSPEERVFVSQFVIDSFTYSHVATYTCKASTASLPFTERDSTTVRINRKSKLYVEAADVEIHSMEPLQFTLVCYSFGGMPANVTWTRDSTVIGSGVTSLREDFTGHRHSLFTTQEGFYTCSVSNPTPESASASINATIPDAPSNVTLTQNSVNTVLVSWTPSDGIEYYTLVYGRDSREELRLNGTSDSVTLELNQYPFHDGYLFEITAHTAFTSPTVGPLEFSLGGLEVDVYLLLYYSGEKVGNAYIGYSHILTCDVLVYGNLNGTLEFNWTGPGELPTPIRTNNTHSELQFLPLRLSQDGEYSCTVKLEGFPYASTAVRDLYTIFPAPITTVKPSYAGPHYAGTALNLTCHMRLYSAIDIPIVEDIQWIFDDTISSTERVTITNDTIQYFPLDVTDSTNLRCRVVFIRHRRYWNSNDFALTVEALPPLQVELLAPLSVTVGDSLTLECSVAHIPSLISPPGLTLVGPEGTVKASADNFSVSITLDSVPISTAGQQYYCQAELEIEAFNISMMSQSENYTIKVAIPRPDVILHKEPAPVNVIIGSTVTLTCVATFEPHVTTDTYFDSLDIVQFTWHKPGSLYHSTTDRGEVYLDKQNGTGTMYYSNFTITEIKPQDEGVYRCKMRILGEKNIYGDLVLRRVSINVFDPPPPVVEITAPSVATGGSSTVAVHCMVTTVAPMLALLTPQSHVELLKKGEVLPVATSQSLNLSHTLSPVLASHAGRYYCRSVLVVEGLDEPLSHNATHVLTVTIPSPTFALSSRPPENMNISLGSTVAFICNVDIDSSYDVTEAVEVSWSGPRMGRSRDGFVTTQSGSGLSYVSVLAILEVTEEDEGEYTCHLSIAGGNHQHIVLSSPTSSMITLGLVPQPTLVISSSEPQGKLKPGSPVTLTCKATLNSQLDSIQFTWGRPHVITTNDDSRITTVRAMHTSSSLTISDVREEDEGVYVCTLRGLDINGEPVTVNQSIAISVIETKGSDAIMLWSGLSSILIATITAVFSVL